MNSKKTPSHFHTNFEKSRKGFFSVDIYFQNQSVSKGCWERNSFIALWTDFWVTFSSWFWQFQSFITNHNNLFSQIFRNYSEKLNTNFRLTVWLIRLHIKHEHRMIHLERMHLFICEYVYFCSCSNVFEFVDFVCIYAFHWKRKKCTRINLRGIFAINQYGICWNVCFICGVTQ